MTTKKFGFGREHGGRVSVYSAPRYNPYSEYMGYITRSANKRGWLVTAKTGSLFGQYRTRTAAAQALADADGWA